MAERLYDRATFIEMSAGSEAVAKQVAELYHRDIIKDLDEIDSSFAGKDLDTIRRLSHRIRSSFAIMGAERLKELSANIEKRSQQGEINIGDMIKELRTLALRLDEEITRDFLTV